MHTGTSATKAAICVAVALAAASLAAPAMAQEIEIERIKTFRDAQSIYPTVRDSVLYFASDQKWDVARTYFNQKDDHLFQLFRVDLRNGKPHGKPRPCYGEGDKPFNLFAISFDESGSAYITQNNMEESVLRGAPLSIFRYDSDKPDAKGTLMANLPKDASNGMASVSADGKFMIFASDMMGGEGRTDLYYCKREGFSWTEPVNLGPAVNTPGVETSPYIHSSGKIFFASNGRNDSQALDIYYTYMQDNGEFAEPVKFDDLVNSVRDDYGLFYSDDETWGFVTSNRDNEDQIYYFRRTFPTFEEKSEMETLELCYTLYEASAENYDTTTFECMWRFGDGESAKGIEVEHCYAEPGTYMVELSVLDKTSGEEMFSLAQYEMELELPDQIEISFDGPIKAGEQVTFTAKGNALKDIYPRAFYWNIEGERTKGDRVNHIFEKAGTYIVECGTIDARNPNVKRCTWVEVTVE